MNLSEEQIKLIKKFKSIGQNRFVGNFLAQDANELHFLGARVNEFNENFIQTQMKINDPKAYWFVFTIEDGSVIEHYLQNNPL